MNNAISLPTKKTAHIKMSSGVIGPNCLKCNDTEFIVLDNNTVGFCECRKQKELQRRVKSSMINPANAGATFENFKILPHNKAMFEAITSYARDFKQISRELNNSLGFLAVVGETIIRSASPFERQRMAAEHNNFGLGKTHLQSALAMQLINQGVSVLMVNDADVIAELREAQFTGEISNKLAEINNAELLIWDDLGKVKYTEWAQTQVYQVFNHRYRNGLPIAFSTNEDMETISEKVGGAVVSRLYSMCRGRWIEVEGPDYRLM